MAGHSKWSKIKRSKGAKDVVRSRLFAKASRAIIVATKNCGGDMANLKLQSAIQHAKSIQLPKDRIQDAINKYQDKNKDGQSFQTIRYDAKLTLGGTKVACIVQALTDNRNRTAASVRATVVRADGELLATAAHDYLFDYVGMVLLEQFDGDEDTLWECALEGGATEVDVDDSSAVMTCEPADLWNLVKVLQEQGYEPQEFEHRYTVPDPGNLVPLTEEGREKLETFLDKMDENEDVTQVFHNCSDPQS
jgi:YebC/PmpR family DNA-binding regulatory protein